MWQVVGAVATLAAIVGIALPIIGGVAIFYWRLFLSIAFGIHF